MSAPPTTISLPAKPPVNQAPDSDTPPPQPTLSSRGHGESETEENKDKPSDSNTLEQPPLPREQPPPLPSEASSIQQEDDGWEPVWDEDAQAFYFYNRISHTSQWENPRMPTASGAVPKTSLSSIQDTGPPGAIATELSKRPLKGGYDPAIHGDYDPDADYAKAYHAQEGPTSSEDVVHEPSGEYAATGAFNRFTGKWQNTDINPDKFSDENKSRRQMNAFFDVDAAANVHNGKSLKAERSGKKISKQELKAFKEKRREKKEEKRRAWLRD